MEAARRRGRPPLVEEKVRRNMMSAKLVVTVPPVLKERLEQEALDREAETGRLTSVSAIVREVLEREFAAA